MAKSKFETFRKRPVNATVERLRELREKGLSYGEIAKIWGISRAAVWRLDHPEKNEEVEKG